MVESVSKTQSAGIQSVEIGIKVLDVFAGSTSAMSLKQVCEASGMAPSKVHRYLVSFVRSGMLIQFGPNGLYDLGPTARRLGLVAMGRLDSFAIASKHLLLLRDTTGHTVCLTIWGDSGPVLVRWENGSAPLMVNLRVGSSMPLTESAIGRLFLAHMPPVVTQPVLKRQKQMASADAGAPSLSDRELEEVRAARTVHLSSALIAGVDAVAAPVFDAQENLSSVICLLASHEALRGRGSAKVISAVEETARRISYELGYGLTEG
ncbi:IclR family transcriptional regulator [Sphingomonas sp. LaA6.9]|uniref:IclR family transcriptional regulator n=1 Tax=Sphingomonas sp. LaA6.9 TaxID=2919914 RepID=UPI001F5023F0|nr:IclR family transcriptional regulator [Sphingomonas sp. LaA6.9]MCJ8159020.1 IclR family transcriptional regulator [Sphingomonas sp. LaA6.9]